MNTLRIDEDGGELLYQGAFLKPDLANTLFIFCRDHVPWRQERGKYRPFPRLTMWYADKGLKYTYSGVTHLAEPWTKPLQLVREAVTKVSGVPYNSLLLNYYRNGSDSIGFHSDAEPELGPNPSIASISLGATRKFVLKHMQRKEELHYDLANGDLIVMQGSSQHNWLHGLPKVDEDVGGRINLTFRYIQKEYAMAVA